MQNRTVSTERIISVHKRTIAQIWAIENVRPIRGITVVEGQKALDRLKSRERYFERKLRVRADQGDFTALRHIRSLPH